MRGAKKPRQLTESLSTSIAEVVWIVCIALKAPAILYLPYPDKLTVCNFFL